MGSNADQYGSIYVCGYKCGQIPPAILPLGLCALIAPAGRGQKGDPQILHLSALMSVNQCCYLATSSPSAKIWAGVRPVPGRSNILSPECAGLITNLPPAARCCSRGRLHSVSVAASPRCVFALKSFRVVSAFASFGATGVYFAVSVFTAFPPSLRFGAASRRDGKIPFRRAEGGGQNRLLRLKPLRLPKIRPQNENEFARTACLGGSFIAAGPDRRHRGVA